jgi:hypothetical protein
MFAILFYGLYSKEKAQEPPEMIHLTIAQEKIYKETLSEYLCPCGACNEVFFSCECPTALKVKKETRKRLAKENASYRDIAWMLENLYKAKRRS